MNKRNIFLSMAALLAVGLSLTSCLDSENPNTIGLGVVPTTSTMLTATLTGAGEKPTSTTSTATGTFTGSLNTTTRVLSYTVTYQGFSEPLTGGHLHRITNADSTGPVNIPFPSLDSPIIATTSTLRQGQVDSLLAGQYYANLHTATYPAGEIRGEVRKK